MEKLQKNYYDLLSVERDADADTIKKGFRKAALEHHPDKGGTDQMFQVIKEAYDVLSDPIRKRNYDRDLSKYGLKDGLKKTKSTTDSTKFDKPAFKKSTTTKYAPEERKAKKPAAEEKRSSKPAPEPTAKPSQVEIPDNLNSLSIKELKSLLTSLGLKHDDCFEKSEMINRVQDFKNKRDGKSTNEAPPRAPSSSNKARETTSNASTSKAGSMGSEEPIAFKILSVGNQEVGKS